MMIRHLLVFLLCTLFAGPMLFADDLFAPSYRGEPLSTSAEADSPTPDPLTGHYYEQTVTSTFRWDEARVEAGMRFIDGVPGHLATITSERENDLVFDLGGGINGFIGLTDSESISTIDGFDMSTLGTAEAGDTSGDPLPAPGTAPVTGERGFGFVWVTGEPFTFQSWRAGEPGDSSGGEDGSEMETGRTWSDSRAGVTLGQSTPSGRRGIFEYDVDLSSQEVFEIRERRAAGTFMGDGIVGNLDDASALLALPSGHPDIEAEATAAAFVLSFHDPDSTFGLIDLARAPFLTDTSAVDEDTAMRAIGRVVIPSAGDWTFAATHSEGIRLTVGGNEFSSINSSVLSGPPRLFRTGQGTLVVEPGGGGDVFYFPSAGIFDVTVLWYRDNSFGGLQLFAAEGDIDIYSAPLFELVGDVINGGLELATTAFFADGFESGTTSAWSSTTN